MTLIKTIIKLGKFAYGNIVNQISLHSPVKGNKSAKIPEDLYQEFTMNGLCSVKYKFLDNATKEIQDQINSSFTKHTFNEYLKKAHNRESNYYGKTDNWLYMALDKYPIQAKNICIFGSANPWYEAIALEFGAANCDVIEYSERVSFDDRIKYIRPVHKYNETYDVAFSISSFEHDGLGRYGDPINPNGDIEAMHNAKKVIKNGGLLFLSVPVGKDKICFNVHRIYGKHRLPLMLEGWKVLDSFGFLKKDINNKMNNINRTPYQPVFVLEKSQRGK